MHSLEKVCSQVTRLPPHSPLCGDGDGGVSLVQKRGWPRLISARLRPAPAATARAPPLLHLSSEYDDSVPLDVFQRDGRATYQRRYGLAVVRRPRTRRTRRTRRTAPGPLLNAQRRRPVVAGFPFPCLKGFLTRSHRLDAELWSRPMCLACPWRNLLCPRRQPLGHGPRCARPGDWSVPADRRRAVGSPYQDRPLRGGVDDQHESWNRRY